MLMPKEKLLSTVRRDAELGAGVIAALVLVVFFSLAISTTVVDLIRLASTVVAGTPG
jgi:hypothetical protein